MAYQVQPQDFSFIAQAGRTVGNAIEKYPEARAADELAKANKIDKDTFDNKIWPAQIDAMQKKATEAGVDSNTALSLSVKYAQKRMSTETPAAAAARIATGETLYNKALEEIKIKTLQQKSAGAPAVPEQPGAQINLEGQRAPTSVQTPYTQQAGTRIINTPSNAQEARLAGQPMQGTTLSTTGLYPGDEPRGSQMPPTPAQPAQQANANDLRSEADKMGLSGNAQADAIVNRAYNTQFNLPAGSRAQAMAETLNKQGGFTPEIKTILKQVQTDQQIANNKRLEQSDLLKAKAAKAHNDAENAKLRFAGKKLDQDTKADIFKRQAEAKKDMLDAQLKVKALEGALTRANKDITGGIDKGEYDTQMKELQDQYEAASIYQETISGYQELLDGTLSNTLSGGSNTKPKPVTPPSLTPGKSQYRITEVMK